MAVITKEQILEVWGTHLARRWPFEAFYQGFPEHVEARNLTCVVDGDLELFHDTVPTQYHAPRDVLTLMARG